MPLVGVKANAGAFGLGWSAVLPGEELGGMVLLTPTSVDITGGGSETATTLANGSVEFSACATLSLNGVFSADYDNYMVTVRTEYNGSANWGGRWRLRASGTDNSTASSYTQQRLRADNTTVSGARSSADYAETLVTSYANGGATTLYVYGAYLAQPTAFRTVSAFAANDAYIQDHAVTHNQSVSYDGFTFFPTASNMVGLVSVYGLVGA